MSEPLDLDALRMEAEAAAVVVSASAVLGAAKWTVDLPSELIHHLAAFDPPTAIALLDLIDTLTAERDRLVRWKAEAMPVMDGLQELGRALDIPLGQRITGAAALAAVEALTDERDKARRDVAWLNEACAGVEAERLTSDLIIEAVWALCCFSPRHPEFRR